MKIVEMVSIEKTKSEAWIYRIEHYKKFINIEIIMHDIAVSLAPLHVYVHNSRVWNNDSHLLTHTTYMHTTYSRLQPLNIYSAVGDNGKNEISRSGKNWK